MDHAAGRPFVNSLEAARALDEADPMRQWREAFHHPVIDQKRVLYFTGNSLGLQPKTVAGAVDAELEHWARLGVEGHFDAPQPWYSYHEPLAAPSARVVGALPSEVVCMNSLTVNLHLLFVSFYRPTAERFKIISEAGMFPSDRYLLETQIRFHGFDPDQALVEVAPRAGEFVIRKEDILDAIDQHRDELALVFFGAINYFNGQWFDLKALTAAAHDAGALAGFDLAHAAGNVPMALHDWNVDFAAWCTYKYLNAGPGNVGSAFVHQRHGADFSLPRFGGWWGHDKDRRFLMEPQFQPMAGADGWQLSNGQVLGMAALKAALEAFDAVGIEAVRAKSIVLTGYLEFVVKDVVDRFPEVGLEQITPADPAQRGCQLSFRLAGVGRDFFRQLRAADVLADYREPDVIRISPVPLYNSFEDVWRLGEALASVLGEHPK